MEIIKKIKNFFLEALFPSICLVCKKENPSGLLCARCQITIRPLFRTLCQVCGKEIGITKRKKCSHSSGHLESVSFLFDYKNKGVRSLVHALKYRYITDVVPIFGDHLRLEKLNILRIPADMILAMPLHKRKLRARGFNQSELIALEVSRLIEKPLAKNILAKIRATPAQMKIKTPAGRQKNVRGIFSVLSPKEIGGKKILLVDDVLTTGATLEEAASALIKAGAKTVFGFVLARD